MTDDVRGMFCQHYELTGESESKAIAPSPVIVIIIRHFIGVSPLLNDPPDWCHDFISPNTGLNFNSVRCRGFNRLNCKGRDSTSIVKMVNISSGLQ